MNDKPASTDATFDKDDMANKLYKSRLGEWHNEFVEWRRSNMTLKEKIINKLEYIPYYTCYYFAYPVLWFTDWLWAGIKDAYEETWE